MLRFGGRANVHGDVCVQVVVGECGDRIVELMQATEAIDRISFPVLEQLESVHCTTSLAVQDHLVAANSIRGSSYFQT